MRALTKHGAAIPDAKHKKAQRKDPPAANKLEPHQLVLNPKHFQDTKSEPVHQISFAQVEANAAGIAIATIEDIAGFLKEQKNISTQALGVLILDQPTDSARSDSRLSTQRPTNRFWSLGGCSTSVTSNHQVLHLPGAVSHTLGGLHHSASERSSAYLSTAQLLRWYGLRG